MCRADRDSRCVVVGLLAAASPSLFVVAALGFTTAAVTWFGLGHGTPASVPASTPSAVAVAPPFSVASPKSPFSEQPAPAPVAALPAPTVAAAPPPPTVPVTAAPQPAPPAPAPVAAEPTPPPPAAAPNPDQLFRRLVLQISGMHVGNWGIAEAAAHRVCGYLEAGHSRDEATQQVLANDPTFTPWQASGMVNASTAAYCPDQ
ncbi:DUF732 domain-containing protein [Mycobacterium avium]|nr:DUF732 domain-containing protein [Mycobacterium avium]